VTARYRTQPDHPTRAERDVLRPLAEQGGAAPTTDLGSGHGVDLNIHQHLQSLRAKGYVESTPRIDPEARPHALRWELTVDGLVVVTDHAQQWTQARDALANTLTENMDGER
jgi:predicted ArsR family transcriptional regulator